MKMKLLNKEKDVSKFVVEGVTPGFLNSIRRAIINRVETLAIDEVSFVRNSSALYDELVAHRLGLIPLTTPKTYNKTEECKCKGKGCARCEVKLTLKKTGPCIVFSGDLKSTDPNVEPVFEDMPIVKLLEDQEIQLEAKAILGIGKKHAKWTPGSAVQSNYPLIKINKAKCKAKCDLCVRECPKDILEIKQVNAGVIEKKVLDCDLCMACTDACPTKAITVESEPNKYIFAVESWGQLKPEAMIKRAIEINLEKLSKLKKSL